MLSYGLAMSRMESQFVSTPRARMKGEISRAWSDIFGCLAVLQKQSHFLRRPASFHHGPSSEDMKSAWHAGSPATLTSGNRWTNRYSHSGSTFPPCHDPKCQKL